MSQIDDPCQVVKSETASVVTLKNKISIVQATTLKELLIDAITEGKPVRVDMSAVSDVDVTTIQLLYAAKNKAIASNVDFNIFPISEPAKEILRLSGALYEVLGLTAEQ